MASLERLLGERQDLVLLGVIVILLLVHAYIYNYVVDDAYISFRYARNLIRGEGLVFNPGEKVEGYTNFLWVILIALGMKLGAEPVALAKTLCFAFMAATVVLVYRYSRSLYGMGRSWSLLAPCLLAGSAPIGVWSLGGLETTMFAFLITAGVLSQVAALSRGRQPVISSLLLVIAALTRPEGLLIALILFVDLCLCLRRSKSVLLWLLPFIVVYLPYFIWRYTYYGYLFPNSFYAKTGGGWNQFIRGLRYTKDFITSSGGLLYALFAVPMIFSKERKFILPGVVWIVWWVYVVVIGGDGLPMYRFAVPVLPIGFLLISYAIFKLCLQMEGGARRVTSMKSLLIVASILLVVLPSISSDEKEFVLEDRIRVQGNWVTIGRWLKSYAKPNESIAVTAAGALPYYSDLYTVDMLGINDVHIAHRKMPEMGKGIAGHEKYDIDYVLDKKPTYIFHYPFLVKRPVITPSQFITEWNPGQKYLFESPRFRTMYEPVSEKIAGYFINFFRLKSEYR